jgi:hypothetical protein
MASYLQLNAADQARFGFTHKVVITFADLTALGAVASGTVALATYTAGLGCTKAAFRLVTAFTGGATSALALDVGHNGATTDDPDSILDNYEVHSTGTEIFFGDGNGAVFATLRTGYYPLDAGTYEATFTATGGNLSVLTAGEVNIYLRLEDLTKV